MTVALHDKNKYRGTLNTYTFHREQVEAMARAAAKKVPRGMYTEAEYLAVIKYLVLQMELDELRTKPGSAGRPFEFDGPLPKEPVDVWYSYDENHDWFEKKYSQGEMAPIH